MRLKIVISCCVAVMCAFFSPAARCEDEWDEARSTHFIVHYHNAKEQFVDEIIKRAEEYYDDIADDLGFRRYDFWLWENRAHIYVYDTSEEYQRRTGQPGWSSGVAIPGKKIIHTFPYAPIFFDTVLPHELGHIIFREFVGFDNPAIPHWVDEVVASYQMHLRYSMSKMMIKEALRRENFIPLRELNQMDPGSLNDTFIVNLFYAESVNVIEYLIHKFGQDAFILFCQELRDLKDLRKALAHAYPYGSIEELEEAWQTYLRKL